MLQSKLYIVRKGDNLSSIAKRNNHPSWKTIYYSKENAALRQKRKSPDQIMPGDNIKIPPSPIESLEYRLKKLREIRQQSIAIHEKLIAEMEADYRKVKRTANTVDITATVALLAVNYGKLAKEGLDTMKLAGKELEKANYAFAKSALTTGPQFVTEQVVQGSSWLKVTGEEGLAWALTKIVVQSWFDMTTPSYWAQRLTGIDIEKINSETRKNLIRQHQSTLESLDRRIAETQKELKLLKRSN